MSDKVKCAVCGLIYDPKKPLPACRSDNGQGGPLGLRPEELRFTKCVLGTTEKPLSKRLGLMADQVVRFRPVGKQFNRVTVDELVTLLREAEKFIIERRLEER